MNNRKNIILILLLVFGLILFYNYIMVPLLVSYNFTGMGMGMGMGMHQSTYYAANNNLIFQFILIIGMIMAAILLVDIFKPVNKCKNCGYDIRDDKWLICPRCGTPIKQRKG